MNTAMPALHGGCHCGEIDVSLATNRIPAELPPRACDCSFCRKHGAAWISDADGRLTVRVRAGATLREYRQGSGHARFLLCGVCGVLVAVVFDTDDGLIGAANAACLHETSFADATTVSPQRLDADSKIARWRQVWTPAAIVR